MGAQKQDKNYTHWREGDQDIDKLAAKPWNPPPTIQSDHLTRSGLNCLKKRRAQKLTKVSCTL